MRRASTIALVGFILSALWGGCSTRAEGIDTAIDAGAAEDDAATSSTSVTLEGVEPSSGPFVGGNRVTVRGTGFSPELEARSPGTTRLWIDGERVANDRIRVVDAQRIWVTMPAHDPGTVDVAVSQGTHRAELEAAYTYDRIAVKPSEGPEFGGTRVEVVSFEGEFEEGDTVWFDELACDGLERTEGGALRCETPSHRPGRVGVSVRRDGEAWQTAADGFRYTPAADISGGGTGGGPIDGQLTVTVRSDFVGAVAGATVLIGADPDTGFIGETDDTGRIVLREDELEGPLDVHVGHRCFHRVSYVGVDARDIVVNAPLIRYGEYGLGPPGPGCIPEGGGAGGESGGDESKAIVRGELVFLDDGEFRDPTARWTGVPQPGAGERRVAYVMGVHPRLGAGLDQRVADAAFGDRGYEYELGVTPGQLTVVATAGIETSDGAYVPYVMGVAPVVDAKPGERVPDVDAVMDIALEGRLDVTFDQVPGAPARVVTFDGVDLGPDVAEGIPVYAFALATTSRLPGLAPVSGRGGPRDTFSFYPMPRPEPWQRHLLKTYVSLSWSTTGAGLPSSSRLVPVGDEPTSLHVTDFLGVPSIEEPAPLGSFRSVLEWSLSGGESPELFLFELQGSLSQEDSGPWRIFVRGDLRSAELPVVPGTGLAPLAADRYRLVGQALSGALDLDALAFREIEVTHRARTKSAFYVEGAHR